MNGRRCSAPELAAATEVQTWIRNELNNAEHIPYNPLNESTRSSTLAAEQQIKQEIETLKKQIQEQNNTFRGQQDQMKLLQVKILK